MPVIFDDANIQVIHAPGNSAFSVATFGTRDERANGQDFWGQTLSRKYGIECFGFVAKAPNWYPSSSMLNCVSVVRPLVAKPLVGYGHSMGGYAVLKYAKMLGCCGAVSSGPQISIDPSDVPTDTRYHGHFHPLLNREMRIGTNDLVGRQVVVYDPTFREDSDHALNIKLLWPNVELLALRYMHHRTAQALRPSNVLVPMFQAIVEGKNTLPWHRVARSNRRKLPDYFIYLARALLGRSKPRFALYVLDTLQGERSRGHELEIALYRARAYTKIGEWAMAKALYQKMLIWQPSHVTAQQQLARIHLLMNEQKKRRMA